MCSRWQQESPALSQYVLSTRRHERSGLCETSLCLSTIFWQSFPASIEVRRFDSRVRCLLQTRESFPWPGSCSADVRPPRGAAVHRRVVWLGRDEALLAVVWRMWSRKPPIVGCMTRGSDDFKDNIENLNRFVCCVIDC